MPTPNQPGKTPQQRPLEDLLKEFELPDDSPEQPTAVSSHGGGPTAVGPAGGSASPPSHPSGSPPAPSTPKSRDGLVVTRARELGMTDAEIDSYSPADLDRTVDLLRRSENRRVSATHAAIDGRSPTAGPASSGHAADASPRPAPAGRPAAGEPPGQFDLGVSEAELDAFDPDFVALLKRVLAPFQAKIDDLTQQLQAVRGWAVERQQAEEFDRFDRAFARVAQVLPATFTAASRHDLDGGGDEMARRRSVVNEMARLQQAANQAGQRLTFDGLFARAVKTLYGAAVPDAAAPSPGGATPTAPGVETPPRPGVRPQRPDGTFMSDAEIAEVEARKQDWQDGVLERPTGRDNQPEPKGERRAVRAVRQIIHSNGPALGMAGGTEEDELPD